MACAFAGDDIVTNTLAFGTREYWHGVVALVGLMLGLNLLGYGLLRRSVPAYLQLASQEAVTPAARDSPALEAQEVQLSSIK